MEAGNQILSDSLTLTLTCLEAPVGALHAPLKSDSVVPSAGAALSRLGLYLQAFESTFGTVFL